MEDRKKVVQQLDPLQCSMKGAGPSQTSMYVCTYILHGRVCVQAECTSNPLLWGVSCDENGFFVICHFDGEHQLIARLQQQSTRSVDMTSVHLHNYQQDITAALIMCVLIHTCMLIMLCKLLACMQITLMCCMLLCYAN